MPITPWLSTVGQIQNGEDVSAEVVNPLIEQLVQREQHLYEKFDDFDDKSVLIAFSQPIYTVNNANAEVKENSVVYYTKSGSNEGVALALVDFLVKSENSTNYTPANSAYSLGIVKQVNNDKAIADVYMSGLVSLNYDIDDPVNGLIQSNEINQAGDFLPGPYYLSRAESGKISANRGGIAVYVGYALSRRSFLLSPNTSELSQFFLTYKYGLLDRPCGIPVLTGNTWTIRDVDLNRVGWAPVTSISSALQLLAPVGAKFFYNLPTATLISADAGISIPDQTEQIDLAKELPPNPPNLTFVTVNGIIQLQRTDTDSDGIYIVNEVGIWWFSDQNNQQPWASDIDAGEQPDNWLNSRGTPEFRPHILLQFIKFNPSIKTSIVTSLKKYNSNSPAISFYTPDKLAESTDGKGDLLARLLLNFINGTNATSSATAIKALTYDEVSGNITAVNTPIVSVLTQGAGVTITPTISGGNTVPGSYIISSSNNNVSGRVTSLEPDGCDLAYTGLHSFLKMYIPSITPSSIIGKITLPAGIPSADMTFVMFAVIPDAGNAAKNVNFDFSYAISTAGSVIDTSMTTTNITFAVPSPYVTKSMFKVGNTTSGIAVANWKIPAIAIANGDVSVNFKLARTLSATNPLTTPFGMVDMYWKIGG